MGHTRHCLLRAVVTGIISGLVAGFVCLLIVPWLGWMWHLVSGDRATIGGVSVRVLSRYFATTDPDGRISQWRCGFGFPLSHAHYGFVRIHQRVRVPRLQMDADFERVRAIVIAERRSSGMMLRSQQVLQTPAGPAACFEFRGKDGASVVCLFFGDHQLTIDYEGDEAFVPDVYEIIRSARLASGGS
jgi:hypothetical protein